MQRELVEQIKYLRRRRGVSQIEVANLPGCNRSRIAKIETGSGSYTLEELEVLALYLGVAFDVLLPDRARWALDAGILD